MSRHRAAVLNGVIIAVVGILAAWSADPAGPLGHLTLAGRGFFDWFDYLSSNIFLPIGGLCMVLFVGYASNKQDVIDQLTNQGSIALAATAVPIFFFLARYVTPALLTIIFLNTVGVLKV